VLVTKYIQVVGGYVSKLYNNVRGQVKKSQRAKEPMMDERNDLFRALHFHSKASLFEVLSPTATTEM
jgi:anthranilate/para-aminobenzoate synthase component II